MNTMASESTLHIPEGINYECTGCGKCCGGWAVPMTEVDYKRISAVDWSQKLDKFKGRSLFRPLTNLEKSDSPYTHAIKPQEDGHCPFLVENLCFIHSQNGAEAKPSICQLFPYCFNETPSGIYATVSFVSMGVIYNSGKALSEQREYLESKLNEFKKLFPEHHPNWSQLQLMVGEPLSWPDYLAIEGALIDRLKDKSKSIDMRFLEASRYLIDHAMSRRAQSGQTKTLPAVGVEDHKLKRLDLNLLIALHRVYFPSAPLSKGEGDFSAASFLNQVFLSYLLPMRIKLPTGSFSIDELVALPWPDNDNDLEDLLFRYFFSRIFAKLYFGAGFGQLSLIAGFHHLIVLLSLIKLQARALALSREAPVVSLVDLVAAIRQLEKRLGETRLGGYAAPLLELLLFSHGRLERIVAASH
jgi:Fe-S-cluster containining protein